MTNIPDWLAALGIISPLIAGLGGHWLAGKNEEKRDNRIAKREAKSRRSERSDRLIERRHESQLDLLLELQEALVQQMRVVLLRVKADQESLRQHDTLASFDLALSQQELQSNANLSRLISRVLDDNLRHELTNFHRRTNRIIPTHPPETPEEINEILVAFRAWDISSAQEFSDLNEKLGAALRSELAWAPDLPPVSPNKSPASTSDS